MLFNIISVLLLLALVIIFFSKNKQRKYQYSNLVTKSKALNSSKRRSVSTTNPINPNYVNEKVKPERVDLVSSNHSIDIPDDFLAFKLLTSSQLDNTQQKLISDISQSFRKPHPLLLPLTQRTFEPNELFDLIRTDTEMTANVLKEVNSPLFGLRQPITDINHAIIFMGVGKVKSIVLQCAMKQGMKFTDRKQNEAYDKLWKASYLASSFCLLFAIEIGKKNPSELATRCLLSYLGDLALLSYKPELAEFYLDDFTLFERTKKSQELLSTNAAIVGKFLAKQWKLPESIESAIEHSIFPLTDTMAHSELSDEQLRHLLLCYLSCRLGDLVAFNDLNEVPVFEEVSFEALGEIEFYYTQKNIQNVDFMKINSVIADENFRKKLNNIIREVH